MVFYPPKINMGEFVIGILIRNNFSLPAHHQVPQNQDWQSLWVFFFFFGLPLPEGFRYCYHNLKEFSMFLGGMGWGIF